MVVNSSKISSDDFCNEVSSLLPIPAVRIGIIKGVGVGVGERRGEEEEDIFRGSTTHTRGGKVSRLELFFAVNIAGTAKGLVLVIYSRGDNFFLQVVLGSTPTSNKDNPDEEKVTEEEEEE